MFLLMLHCQFFIFHLNAFHWIQLLKDNVARKDDREGLRRGKGFTLENCEQNKRKMPCEPIQPFQHTQSTSCDIVALHQYNNEYLFEDWIGQIPTTNHISQTVIALSMSRLRTMVVKPSAFHSGIERGVFISLNS